MQGYYKGPDATREVIDEEGWFHTGDIGYLDADNYLFITDRKKDLIKTAGGKFVAPQPIENALKTSPYILNAMIVGDQRRFVVALIVPNAATVSAKLQDQGVRLASHEEMAAHPAVRSLIETEVKRLTAHLAQWETIKRFALLPTTAASPSPSSSSAASSNKTTAKSSTSSTPNPPIPSPPSPAPKWDSQF